MFTNPLQDLREAELTTLNRTIYEFETLCRVDLEIEAVPPQEDISGSEGNSFIAIDEAVVIGERLHQCCCFFFQRIVISNLGPKNGGLHSAFVADAGKAAEHFQQEMLHPVDFGHRKVV